MQSIHRNTAPLLLLLLGATLLGASTLALAAPPFAHGERPDIGARLAEVDSNDDGMISREEFVAARADHFAMLDRDGDGYFSTLDIPEQVRGRERAEHHLEKMLAEFDQDGDRLISAAEFASGPTPRFDRADANGDGQIDATEVHALHPAHHRPDHHMRPHVDTVEN